MSDPILAALEANADEAREFLKDLIRLESVSGSESEAIDFCCGRFAQAGLECKLAAIPESIKDDPEYSSTDGEMSYEGRANLAAFLRGSGGGRSLILQSHVDTVGGDDWPDAFAPREEDGTIIGRGACDAKGQVATIWLAAKALCDLGAELEGDLQVQVVVEEEFGGNGALALIRQGYSADAALIMESTQLQIHPSNRGCLWYRIEIEGLPCHMGRKNEGISAVDLAHKVVQALYDYEKRLVADSSGYRGFERYEMPVQVNVGVLSAGSWPATVAGTALMEGGVGFLPNRTIDQVKREVRETVEGIDDDWLRSHYKLDFRKLHNDSYEIDFSHPSVLALQSACRGSGLASEVFGFNVSCDARLYAKLGGMPTIVFGPGSVTDAHGRDEKIEFAQVVKAAEAIVRFAAAWCGRE